MKALVVAAHDDDIPLWIGGTVLHMSAWEWTGVAMCWRRYSRTDEHKAHFQQSCQAHGIEPRICDFQDYQSDNHVNSLEQMSNQVLEAVTGETFDYVFTHSRQEHCEYGRHANHVEVRRCVESLVSQGRLLRSGKGLLCFAYKPIYNGRGLATVAMPPEAGRVHLQLTYDELAAKLDWITSFVKRFDCIRGDLHNLGYPCPNPEAFEGDVTALPRPSFVKG